MPAVKSVAVIGAGPAGAITVDALAQEKAFDVIKVFERRDKAGGCWIADPEDHKQQLPDLDKIAQRIPDEPLQIPESLPAKTPKSRQYRFSDTSIYPYLETNIDAGAMSFSQEPFPKTITELSIQRHGHDSPFRHWSTVQQYIEGLLNRNGYQDLVTYNTTVEHVIKDADTGQWTLTLRKELPDGNEDIWTRESFDAVVVASGHYNVPYIPSISGVSAFADAYPGTIEHTKSFRDPAHYTNKKVVVIGASISGADISSFVAPYAAPPLISVVRGKYHPYFSDYAFQHPNIERKGPIVKFESEEGKKRVTFEDGSFVDNVDHVIFGTGYSWTVPFLKDVGVEVRNNRLPGLYQHIFWRKDPSLCFVGAVAAGFTFKVYEWQSVFAARYLAGRIQLPYLADQEQWEKDRIAYKGDGVAFTALYPDFEEYFEEIRVLAGPPTNGVGRPLPKFGKSWRSDFDAAHIRRINMWKRINAEAEKNAKKQSEQKGENGIADDVEQHLAGKNGVAGIKGGDAVSCES